jgi:hypothetical protein
MTPMKETSLLTWRTIKPLFEIGILRGHGKPAREHGLGTRLLQSIDMKE